MTTPREFLETYPDTHDKIKALDNILGDTNSQWIIKYSKDANGLDRPTQIYRLVREDYRQGLEQIQKSHSAYYE